MNDVEDFVRRCALLKTQLLNMTSTEESCRVWTSVMCEFLRAMAKSQENPNGALEQIIAVLRREAKDE